MAKGQATSVSDLERAEHLAYADSKGVKRVSIFNDGIQVNSATEEKQDAIIEAIEQGGGSSSSTVSYNFMDKEVDGNYKYFGFKTFGGSTWKIMRKNLTTGSFRYVYGDDDYPTAWTNKQTLIYT